MVLQPVCVVDVSVAHMEVSNSYLGTGSTWCTWKKNLESLFHIGTGLKMRMYHPSGRESEPLFRRAHLVSVLVMASPAVTQGPRSIQPRLKAGVRAALMEETFEGFAQAIENPHNDLHISMGCDMRYSDTASYDPLLAPQVL